MPDKTKRYVAFLRGINVGGHHKVPMVELRKMLEQLKMQNVMTLLNSGNIIFESRNTDPGELESLISQQLENTFGFPVPTLVRSAADITRLHADAPFRDIAVTPEVRLYISFLKERRPLDIELPWNSDDGSFRIIDDQGRAVLSVLDLSKSKTPKAMEALEKFYGKDITTRNWKTIERIVARL